MDERQTKRTRRARAGRIGVCCAVAILGLGVAGAAPAVAQKPPEQSEQPGELEPVKNTVDELAGHVKIVVGALAGLGVVGGGGMLAMGQPGGVRIMGMAAGAGLAIPTGEAVSSFLF